MRSKVEGPAASEEPLHRAAPKAQFIQSDAADGVEGRGRPPRETIRFGLPPAIRSRAGGTATSSSGRT
jgi:hypothetical protein